MGAQYHKFKGGVWPANIGTAYNGESSLGYPLRYIKRVESDQLISELLITEKVV